MIQLISGYSALKYTANKQATYVRIMNLHNHVPASSKESKYKIQWISYRINLFKYIYNNLIQQLHFLNYCHDKMPLNDLCMLINLF